MTLQHDTTHLGLSESVTACEPACGLPETEHPALPTATEAGDSSALISLEASLRIAGTFVFVAILVHLLRGDPPVPLRPMQIVSDRSFVQQDTTETAPPVPDLNLKPAPRVKAPIRALPASYLPQGN